LLAFQEAQSNLAFYIPEKDRRLTKSGWMFFIHHKEE
jgi:hypothetical protein